MGGVSVLYSGECFLFLWQIGHDASPAEVCGPGLRPTPTLQEVLWWL